mmetsp:Transcript_34374/g.75770  ORF Transcript_34374/g.75770 Transcript_34374/m.75770 type:complete len:214 (-) Transcript_34374:468-1109(-)
MMPPTRSPPWLKDSCRYLPIRLLLCVCAVQALPKASMMGVACLMRSTVAIWYELYRFPFFFLFAEEDKEDIFEAEESTGLPSIMASSRKYKSFSTATSSSSSLRPKGANPPLELRLKGVNPPLEVRLEGAKPPPLLLVWMRCMVRSFATSVFPDPLSPLMMIEWCLATRGPAASSTETATVLISFTKRSMNFSQAESGTRACSGLMAMRMLPV